MLFQLTNFSAILFITTVINFMATYISWQRRETKGGLYFAYGMMGITLWTLAAGFDYAAIPIHLKVFFAKLESTGYNIALSLLAVFSVVYAGHDGLLKRKSIKAFFALPLISILLAWTNEMHGWLWSGFALSEVGENTVVFKHGPGFIWVASVGYLMVMIMLANLWQASRQGSELVRKQARLLIIAIMIPIFSNLLYLFHDQTASGIDWSSITFSFSGLIFIFALYSTRFLDIGPVARRTTFELMQDGVVVLDTNDHFVDFNNSAQEIFNLDLKYLGSPIQVAMRYWPDIVEFASSVPGSHVKVTIIDRGKARVFDMRLTALEDERKQVYGKLLVFRDITKQHLAERALGERVKELKSIYELSLLVEKPGISLEEILQESIHLITAAMQFPKLAWAKLLLDERVYSTENYQERTIKIAHEVVVDGQKVGTLEVGYLNSAESEASLSFLKEEETLLEIMAERLGDVIQKVRAEKAIQENEQILRTIAENYPNSYLAIIEKDFTIGFTSGQEFKKQNLEPSQFIGLQLEEYFGDQSIVIQQYCEKTFRGDEQEFELFINEQNQLFRTVPLYKEDGSVPRVLVVIENITNRRRSERLNRLRLELWEYAASNSLNDLMQRALDEICTLTGSSIGFYHFVEEDQKTLSLQAWSTRTLEEFCKTEGQGLHYAIGEAGVWADAFHQRKPVIHNDYAALSHRKGMPEGHAEVIRQLVVPVQRDKQIVSILGVGNKPTDYNKNDVELVSTIADLVWTIVSQKRSDEKLRQAKDQLMEQQRELAKAEERQRMARDLHDSVNQSINSMVLFSETLASTLEKRKFERAGHIMERLQESARQSLKETRLMLYELQTEGPGRSVDLVRNIENRLATVERRAGLRTQFIQDGSPEDYPLANDENLFWIAIEALNNSLKHAQARGVKVSLRCLPQCIELEIRDDGIGFDPEKVKAGGMGLDNMRARADIIGGDLTIESQPGEGTTVRFLMTKETE